MYYSILFSKKKSKENLNTIIEENEDQRKLHRTNLINRFRRAMKSLCSMFSTVNKRMKYSIHFQAYSKKYNSLTLQQKNLFFYNNKYDKRV